MSDKSKEAEAQYYESDEYAQEVTQRHTVQIGQQDPNPHVEAAGMGGGAEYIWETFDGLFKTIHRQTRRLEELEGRVNKLGEQLDKILDLNQRELELWQQLKSRMELALNNQEIAHKRSLIKKQAELPKFYECGICERMHPAEWDGDCRDDANRFSGGELDDEYGEDGWEEVEQPE